VDVGAHWRAKIFLTPEKILEFRSRLKLIAARRFFYEQTASIVKLTLIMKRAMSRLRKRARNSESTTQFNS